MTTPATPFSVTTLAALLAALWGGLDAGALPQDRPGAEGRPRPATVPVSTPR